MIKWLEGWFIQEKSKTATICFFVFVILISEFAYCYVLKQKNATLTIELKKLTIQVENPTVIEKPKVIVKYVDRVITKTVEGEGQTLILETERIVESNGGREITPFTGDNQSPDKNWTAGVMIGAEIGNTPDRSNLSSGLENNPMIVGVIVTKRIYKTFECGVHFQSNRVAGVIGAVRFK